MKPVLQTVIDKNGGETTVFHPTARMILFSVVKSRHPGMSDEEACLEAQLDPQLPARWAGKYGSYYLDWIEEAIDQGVAADDAAVLERVGMVNALQGNFQFWREMARTKGVIKEELPSKGITINTDFTVVLAAVGGDVHAARARLLQAARGLGDPGGSGMASPLSLGQPAGAGARAGELQARPVEMAHALGANRGRAEQGPAIPAVSKQAAFASTYVVLDEGEVPTGAEEPPDDSDLAL